MNKRIIIIAFGLGILLLVIITVYWVLSFQQQELTETNPEPAISTIQKQDSQLPNDQKVPGSENDAVMIDDEVVIEPTRLTPVPPPPSLDELNELLQDPMDYESITIRYSQQRDTYILYFAGDQEEARDDFTQLMSEYGNEDISQLNIEYENLEAPLFERPPVTITLPDEQ